MERIIQGKSRTRYPIWVLFLCLLIMSCSLFERREISPNELSQIGTTEAYAILVDNDIAYISNNNGIVIFDVLNPTKPRKLTSVPVGENFALCKIQDTLYSCGEQFSMIDVSHPAQPAIIAEFGGVSGGFGLSVRDGYAYSCNSSGTLSCLDIRNPEEIQIVNSLPYSGHGSDLAIHGDVLYYANPQNGLQIVDIQNPAAPKHLRTVPASAGAWDIYIQDDQLYLGRHRYGVNVYDIQNPTYPRAIGNFNNMGEAYGVSAEGERLYVADLAEGVKLLDVSDPSYPVLMREDRHYAPHDLFVHENIIYLSDQDLGLVIMQFAE